MNPDFEAAKKRLEQIKNSTRLFQKKEGDKKEDLFFKPSEDKKTIRILPRSDCPVPMFEAAYHFNIGGQKVYCPQKNEGESCPICDFHKKLRLAKDPKAQNVESKWTYTAIVLERAKDGSFDKPKLWTFSSGKLYEDFIQKLGDEDYCDYTSFGPKGWDWKVQKVQNTNPTAFTKHRIDCVAFKLSTLTEDSDVIEGINASVIDLEKFYSEKLLKRQTSEQVSEIFDKWASDSPIENVEVSEEEAEKIVGKIKF